MANLWQVWLNTAKKNSSKIVLIDALTKDSLTAEQLTERANLLANQLPNLKHQLVAFSLPNNFEWLILFLALQKKEAIALPLDSLLTPKNRREQAFQLGASYLWQEGQLYFLKKIKIQKNFCCIKLTSGSTGQSQKNYCGALHLIADGKNIIQTMKIFNRDINLGLIPLGHSYGMGNLLMPLLLQGTSLVIASQFVPAQIPKWIQQFRVTVFPSVPIIFRLLSQLPSARSLKPLRLAISAGALLDAEIAQAFYRCFKIKLHNFYGSSETGGICYDQNGKASLSGRAIGKALNHVKISVGLNRRIRVQSQAVANSRKSFLLSDLGKWNRYGELQLLGRKKTVANVGGKKIDPLEIENNLRSIPGTTEVWVTIFQDKQKQRQGIAAAVESIKSEKIIRQQLSEKLSGWKLPKTIYVAKQLPRTSRGKLDLISLRQKLRILA